MPQERNIQRRIIETLHDEGIWAGKMNIEGRNGYPDVIAMKNGKVALLEVKADEAARRANTDRNELQRVRHDELQRHGIPVAVVISVREAMAFARKALA